MNAPVALDWPLVVVLVLLLANTHHMQQERFYASERISFVHSIPAIIVKILELVILNNNSIQNTNRASHNYED